jgi:type IV secretion system protein VirB6
VFVVLALFSGSRGLFVGWLRGLVMTAVTPLFVVVGGGLTLELLVPIVAGLRSNAGVDGRASLALFLIASVHLALMIMMLKVSGSVVSAWTVFGFASVGETSTASQTGTTSPATAAAPPAHAVPAAQPHATMRSAQIVPAAMAAMAPDQIAAGSAAHARTAHTIVNHVGQDAHQSALPSLPPQRARGVGSRFRAAPPQRLREYSR